MEPKGLVLCQRTDTFLRHSHQPPSLTISVSSILNVAAFQDATPVSSMWHFARDIHIQYWMHFFSFQPSPFLIVNGLRLEIQSRLLAVVILVLIDDCNFLLFSVIL